MWNILHVVAIKMLLSTAGKIKQVYLSLIEHTEVQFYFCHYFFFAAIAVALFPAPIPGCDTVFTTAFNKNTAEF